MQAFSGTLTSGWIYTHWWSWIYKCHRWRLLRGLTKPVHALCSIVHVVYKGYVMYIPESIVTLPPFGPIEGYNWFHGGSNDTIGSRVRLRRLEISPMCPLQLSPILGSSPPPRVLVLVTSTKFIVGVIVTGDKHSFANISANFRKKSKRPHWNTWGPGWQWSWKKTRSLKSRVRLPLIVNS